MCKIAVAPFVGAWIEIDKVDITAHEMYVAPFVGAWIEILQALRLSMEILVAPFVGAWIEMGIGGLGGQGMVPSLRSSERGLK